MARYRRNPKTRDLLKVGVVLAAGYGVLSAYQKIKGGSGGGEGDTRTPQQRCRDEGGIWVPYPTFLPDETGTAGYCDKRGAGT